MKKFLIIILFLVVQGGVWAQSSLSLADAISKALENNYGILMARNDLDIARLRNNWGEVGRYPYINLSASDNNSLTAQDGNNLTSLRMTGGISLNWTLFDGFSVRIAKNRLEELQQLSENSLAIMVESTVQSVILAYYDVLLQEEILNTYREIMSLSGDRYEQAKQKREYGSMGTYDLLQAQNAYLADRSAYLLQEVAYRNSKRNLAFLLGEKDVAPYNLTDTFSAVPVDYSLDDLSSQMLENNKSLKNQYINQRLFENAISAAKSSFSPTLSFSGGATGIRQGMKLGVQDMAWENSANLYGNFTLSWNMFSGGKRKRAAQIAQIEKETGDVQLTEMQHELSIQLANLFELYQARRELLDVARENLNAAKLNLQLSKEKFEAGSINSFNYRDVQQIYLRAAHGELQAVYNLIDTQTSLLRLAGVIMQVYE